MLRYGMKCDMVGGVSAGQSPCDDPFQAYLEAFIATFCGTADFSIPSAGCTRQESLPEALATTEDASTATVVPLSATTAIKALERTSFHGDYRPGGRLT